MTLTLTELRTRIQNFGKSTASYWGCALLGEIGELANLIKKYERDNFFDLDEIRFELADIFIYLELVSRFISRDLEISIELIEKNELEKPKNKLPIIICNMGKYIGSICGFITYVNNFPDKEFSNQLKNNISLHIGRIYLDLVRIADYFQINLLQAIDEKITIVNERIK